MKRHRFQNKVAGSVFTLPVCIVLAVALWWWPQQAFSIPHLLGLLLCLLTTYIVMETNAQQHIIRIRTRIMSCVWLVLAACLSSMHALGEPIIAAACLCTSYLLLFRCYQRHRPQTIVFHVFLMLSIGSFFAPIMLPMAIPFFLYIAIFLRSLTKKAFWAGVLGLSAPYMCYAVGCFLTVDIDIEQLQLTIHNFISSIEALASDIQHYDFSSFQPFNALPSPEFWQEHFAPLLEEDSVTKLYSVSLIILLSIISIMHYLRTNYDDKIRVRMILYIYMTQTLLLFAFLLLKPTHYESTLALLVASASPLIAHYFALTGSILSNIFFILSLLLTVGMAVLNLFYQMSSGSSGLS